jgi:ABC-type dipeptide/oligopeptide/nickel transport system permease subunit
MFRGNKLTSLGAAITLLFLFLAVFGPEIAPYDPDIVELRERLQGPSAQHIMGTDEMGRDVASRLLHGARISTGVALLSVALAVLFGVALGATAGYFGGRWDMIAMRLVDVLLAFPSLILAIALISVLEPGVTSLIIAVSVTRLPTLARLARGSILATKEFDYVLAARCVGVSDRLILLRHLLPNAMSPLVVQATLSTGGAIIHAATLGFLGLGVQAPTPEWGAMLSRGRTYTTIAPHVVVFPGVAIALFVFGLNTFGDGLRDALDPMLRRLAR